MTDSPARPAADLAEVWSLLDALPPATASAALAATTVDLAAVEIAGGPAASATSAGRGLLRFAGPAAVVAAALVAGVVAGLATAPDPDRRILESLPIVRHLDLLREAGSIKFLEEMHRRRYPLPLRLAIRQGPEARAEDRRQFEAAIAALGDELGDRPMGDVIGERRRRVQALPDEERLELEKAAEQYIRLSATERRSVEAVAGALVDPARDDLREAAALWHQWLLSIRPEDRPGIVTRGTDKRLEWLGWYAAQPGRFDPRLEGRGGERPPRGPDGRPRREERPPFRPDGRPRPGPPGAPGENPARPR